MIIIPAIDIYENKVVRLKKGDFNQVSFYPQTPLEQAKKYEDHGFHYLHIIDLSGSKTGTISVLDTIREIKAHTNLLVEFGGGIRNEADISGIFMAGVDRLIIGSLSIKDKPEFEKIAAKYDPESIIIAADVKDEMIAVKGWTEQTDVSIYSHIEYCQSFGINTFLCTDIAKDGLLTGTNKELYSKILSQYPDIRLIASGGIKDIEDVRAVGKVNVYGVVIGRAIYENKIDLKELAQFGK